ncbi:transmembrane protein 158 [Lethenteron reissneri]|uniref:transmembrane protein 158 n=1 Tax=Lethenteron reissneri TaxID=7753 RepID=UPI002AB6F7F5|nr:transmembrane protein 158 [Lethenteron reissneri]
MRPARSATCSTIRSTTRASCFNSSCSNSSCSSSTTRASCSISSCSNSSCCSSSCCSSSCCWWSHRQLRAKVAVAPSCPLRRLLLMLLTMMLLTMLMMTVVGSQPVAEATSRWTLGTTVAAAAAAVPGVSPGSPHATPRPRGDPASPDPVSPDPASPDPVSPDPASPDPVSPDPASPDPASPGPDPEGAEEDTSSDCPPLDDDAGARADATCNISLTPGTTGLQARWSGTGSPPCDLHIFSTNPGRASSFSTSFTRVRSPLLLERHLGEDDGHGYRACVSCAPTASLGLRAPRARPFCCRDMSRAEVYLCPGCGGEGPRVREGGRGPLEAAVVACFMTAVLTVWVVAALVWPVPIVAEFLPSLLTEPRGRRVAARR